MVRFARSAVSRIARVRCDPMFQPEFRRLFHDQVPMIVVEEMINPGETVDRDVDVSHKRVKGRWRESVKCVYLVPSSIAQVSLLLLWGGMYVAVG